MLITLGREPHSLEAARLGQFLQQQREAFTAHPEDAETVVKTWIDKPPMIIEAAAWTAVSRALLNLDEFITRE